MAGGGGGGKGGGEGKGRGNMVPLCSDIAYPYHNTVCLLIISIR